MRRLGIEGFYGDVDRPELLAAAGLADAKAVVVAIDDPEQAVRLVRYVRRRHPQVADHRPRPRPAPRLRARSPQARRWRARGLRRPRSRPAGTRSRRSATAEHEIDALLAEFVRQDERMLEELAALWRPDMPADRNAAYLAKEREQLAAIEAAVRARGGPRAPGRAEPGRRTRRRCGLMRRGIGVAMQHRWS